MRSMVALEYSKHRRPPLPETDDPVDSLDFLSARQLHRNGQSVRAARIASSPFTVGERDLASSITDPLCCGCRFRIGDPSRSAFLSGTLATRTETRGGSRDGGCVVVRRRSVYPRAVTNYVSERSGHKGFLVGSRSRDRQLRLVGSPERGSRASDPVGLPRLGRSPSEGLFHAHAVRDLCLPYVAGVPAQVRRRRRCREPAAQKDVNGEQGTPVTVPGGRFRSLSLPLFRDLMLRSTGAFCPRKLTLGDPPSPRHGRLQLPCARAF